MPFYFFNTVFQFNKFLLKGCQTFIQFCIREFNRSSYFLPCFLNFGLQFIKPSIQFFIFGYSWRGFPPSY
jgi:hypothetical protein